MIRRLQGIALLLSLAIVSFAQSSEKSAEAGGRELKFAVYVMRHGVRSPTALPEQYRAYSRSAWPSWEVAPGQLTSHGYHLIELLGAFDRAKLAGQGLLPASDCAEAARVTVHADSDQRTRETGRALAAGLFPGCKTNVTAQPEGTEDPLFHSLAAGVGKADQSLAAAAISGRIGGDAENLSAAYRTQLAEFDKLLAECGTASEGSAKRTSLLDVPAKLGPGKGDHAAELKGPLNTASTLTENILLEYAEGMENSKVAWGCVDGARVRALIDLHTAATDYTQRTWPIAQMQASNLLEHIRLALEQAATGKSLAGAPSKPTDRALFLVGHDTNLTNMAGLLNLTWIADGRRNDTPPGSALIFELWRDKKDGSYSVQLSFATATLEQMRTATPLTTGNAPVQVPLYLPGCSDASLHCSWPTLRGLLTSVIDQHYVASEK